MKQSLRNNSLRRGEEVPASGRGYAHVCPFCGEGLSLHDLRDGDQAYWCAPCNRGHRAGELPHGALRPLPQAG